MFVPYFELTRIGEQDYLNGGVFPIVSEAATEPAPEALFDQFEDREALIYYDWEITAARINAFQQAERFLDLVFPPATKQDSTHGVEWLDLIFQKLENSITEASLSGPNEVNVVRKSAIGFTGIELWLLSHWLDSADFPAFPYGAPIKRAGSAGLPGGKPLPRAQPVNR